MKLKDSLIIALFISSAIGLGAFWMFQNQQEAKIDEIHAKEEQSTAALKIAQDLINKSHPRALLAFARLNEGLLDEHPQLMLQAAKDLRDGDALQELYEQNPELIAGQEDLSLILAEHALLTNNAGLFAPLHETWKQKSQNEASWLLLESDALTLRGEPEKAVDLLKSQNFQNKKEEEKKRLIRLALLHEKEHPKVAFDYLTQAFPFTQEQDDLHFFRAKVLEEGSHYDLAVREYQEAIQKNRDNPLYADELVSAYLAQGKLQEAYQLVESALKNPINGVLWLKAYFLNSIYRPVSYNFSKNPFPAGDLNPLLRYLSSLNPNEIWNEGQIKSSPEVQKLANNSPEMLWLEVIFALNVGHEEKAFEILKDHPEIAMLSPELYSGLQKAIAYRHPEMNLVPSLASVTEPKTKHSIFTQLKKTPYPQQVQVLLSSQDGYAALFLAAGWNEAALEMLEHTVLPADFPRWAAYGFTQAFILNRGASEALDFAIQQKSSPQLTLLIAELDLKMGRDTDAEMRLSLLKSPTEIGAKAAKLLASSYASQGIFPKAKEIAQNNLLFSKSIAGQEFIANMDLKMGNIKAAEEIYQKILKESPTAKSYVAMQAFQAGKYPLAYKLMKELLDQYPDRHDLKERIVQIRKAAKEATEQKST